MSTIDGADAKTRKAAPIFSGVFKYFPDALVEVARISKIGNDQHNPGQPMHWSKHKSCDHGDCIARHQLDFEGFDADDTLHAAKVAWRSLAQLQMVLEAKAAGLSYDAYVAKLVAEASQGTAYCGPDRRSLSHPDRRADKARAVEFRTAIDSVRLAEPRTSAGRRQGDPK